MADIEQIERELKAYLEEEDNLSKQDKFTYLKAIFDKHYTLEKMDHMIHIKDFNDIVSYAKSRFADTALPMRISDKEVHMSEAANALMIDSVIVYLNKMKLLKRLVKINFTR